MEIMDYILESRLILMPVLYIIGSIITKLQVIQNKFIPLITLGFGITFSLLMGGNTIIDNIIQGVLVAGATVLTNQVIKQTRKSDDES